MSAVIFVELFSLLDISGNNICKSSRQNKCCCCFLFFGVVVGGLSAHTVCMRDTLSVQNINGTFLILSCTVSLSE